MPPDHSNEQGLILKKRARRRLVGAIALVLLMVIVLPQILQDRATLTQHEAIKITMSDSSSGQKHDSAAENLTPPQENEITAAVADTPHDSEATQTEVAAKPAPTMKSPIASKEAENKKDVPKKTQATPPAAQVEKKERAEAVEVKSSEVKAPAIKPDQKQNEHFTVQVGVYSDMANVKRLQDQLKQAGYSTSTEKVTTPKGESIRLKAGSFTTRQAAVNALEKLKAIGLTGIVIGND